MIQQASLTPIVTFTPAALAFVAARIQKENGVALRLSVKDSGCNGFAYVTQVVDAHTVEASGLAEAPPWLLQILDVGAVDSAPEHVEIVGRTRGVIFNLFQDVQHVLADVDDARVGIGAQRHLGRGLAVVAVETWFAARAGALATTRHAADSTRECGNGTAAARPLCGSGG